MPNAVIRALIIYLRCMAFCGALVDISSVETLPAMAKSYISDDLHGDTALGSCRLRATHRGDEPQVKQGQQFT